MLLVWALGRRPRPCPLGLSCMRAVPKHTQRTLYHLYDRDNLEVIPMDSDWAEHVRKPVNEPMR